MYYKQLQLQLTNKPRTIHTDVWGSAYHFSLVFLVFNFRAYDNTSKVG